MKQLCCDQISGRKSGQIRVRWHTRGDRHVVERTSRIKTLRWIQFSMRTWGKGECVLVCAVWVVVLASVDTFTRTITCLAAARADAFGFRARSDAQSRHL